MPPLNFDDTTAVAERITIAGAPNAAAYYPRHPRALNAIFAELRSLQDDKASFIDRDAVRSAELARRLAGTQIKNARKEIEDEIAEHGARRKRRLAEFAERSEAANAKMDTDGRCAASVNEFLKDRLSQSNRLRDVPLPIPALLPAGLAATIEAKRAELTVNSERHSDIERRPAQPPDLKAAISRAVASEAEKGRPPFDPRIRGRDPSKFADQLVVGVHTGQFLTVGRGGVPFLVWLLADQIEARLHALVDEADLTSAMSDAEQAAALAALDAERLAIEREEEALIRMAEAQGMTITRRADASPMAVLMVEVR